MICDLKLPGHEVIWASGLSSWNTNKNLGEMFMGEFMMLSVHEKNEANPISTIIDVSEETLSVIRRIGQ